ncbi:MAG: hypothetical protein Unbinned3891contig1000_86 [Prokaryotic dsDNA virus sp.]|nr:MAG: hypothetical protein Unbinned3891contig1000_86 [Prokaryotic dsDNA virus sp.]|tara:strand:- start:43009 stop:43440 length:432 start_codon:yes stop_codon:yes gene_type:complete
MSSPADIIAQHLIDEALGTDVSASASWPVRVGFQPDEPDNAICVFDITGREDGRNMSTGYRVEHPGVQVYVRGSSYIAGFDKAEAIALALDAILRTQITIDSTVYLVQNVSRTGPILSVGVTGDEDRKRHQFTINATLTYREN